jgi:flagellar basal-body rod modification protein FlgD
MTQIASTGAATTPPTATSSSAAPSAAAMLGKDDFLKLMMVQLQHQDPLSPSSDPSQYLSQLAQFTALEQETNTAKYAAQTASQQQAGTALSLLGRSVTYTDSGGAQQSGTVTRVDFSPAGPTLTVGTATGIDPTTVSEVS